MREAAVRPPHLDSWPSEALDALGRGVRGSQGLSKLFERLTAGLTALLDELAARNATSHLVDLEAAHAELSNETTPRHITNASAAALDEQTRRRVAQYYQRDVAWVASVRETVGRTAQDRRRSWW